MISNTDSTLFIYSREHMRVKVYTGGAQATVAEVGFDSLEWLLKRLSALAELTHKLAKKLWALWLGLGGVALAGHSGQAQAALLLPPQSNSLHGLSKSWLSPPCVRISSASQLLCRRQECSIEV
jgi:hypothetical protein